ncbi:MAG: hypothetical protein JWM71_1877, partial [Solirubrobacteraceae bacterium]|nr:hypothetical protein [Solirubrobacteraceae bacterium]
MDLNPLHAIANVGKAIGNGVTGLGHVVGTVASNPLVEGVLGATLGPGAAALAGGFGHLLAPGGNLGTAATGALTGGAAGLAGKALGPAVRAIPGIGSILGGGAPSGAPGGDGAPVLDGNGMPIDVSGGGASGGGSTGNAALDAILGLGKSAVSAVKDNALPIGMLGLAGAQAINAGKASARAGTLQDKALGLADSNWKFGEDLRNQGRARLLSPSTVDRSALFADPTNPFAAPPRPAAPTIAGGPSGPRPVPLPVAGPTQAPVAAAPSGGGLSARLRALQL